jgi:tetratricopeptide (TPR) repeat protein
LKKDLKNKIKRDELVTGYERARVSIDEHLDELKIAGVVLVVLAVGALALRHFSSQRDHDAREALALAVETYRSPIVGEEASERAGTMYGTAEEKYRKALGEFEGIERRYGSHAAAMRARYYAALCRIELGQNEEAEKALKEIASQGGGDRLEPALARLAVADLQRRMGQIDRAADAYKQIVAETDAFPLPRDHAALSLAKMYEEAKRPADAATAYRELIDRFPTSSYVNEARQRVEFLQARG